MRTEALAATAVVQNPTPKLGFCSRGLGRRSTPLRSESPPDIGELRVCSEFGCEPDCIILVGYGYPGPIVDTAFGARPPSAGVSGYPACRTA